MTQSISPSLRAGGGLKLYDITADICTALASLEDTGGELTPDVGTQLDALAGDFAAKAERIVKYIRNLEADAAACAAEADRFRHRAAVCEKAVAGLKAYLKTNMERAGLTRVDAGLFRVAVRRNSQPAVTCDVALTELGQPWVTTRWTYVLDRDAVLAAVKAGQELPAGVNVTVGSHLRIT